MRHMSFALTTTQVRNQTKTVTRRLGWQFLKPGDLVQPVVKAQGLRNGEKLEKIGSPVRIVSIRREPLNAITLDDCEREGFKGNTETEFVSMFCREMDCAADAEVTRIEFTYTAPGAAAG